ncbi:MAG: NB-ARC domain-containing protein [Cyanobacteria bacterium P01_F01_bin.150]
MEKRIGKGWNNARLHQLAQSNNVSADELSTLEMALNGNTAEAIATSQGISTAAVRKRLSSVYTKFDITGTGPGKLEALRYRIYAAEQIVCPTTANRLDSLQPGQMVRPTTASKPDSLQAARQSDWGNAVSTIPFHGRVQEKKQLSAWLQQDECRLIVITGMGGIGKTTLAINVALDHQTHFQVIWRSLREAPTLDILLADILGVLTQQAIARPEHNRGSGPNSNAQSKKTSDAIDQAITQLILQLTQAPCLLLLDNVESIFESKTAPGQYRPGYEDYGKLFRLVGQSQHQSSVLMTSREKPPEVSVLERCSPYIHALELQGSVDIGHSILSEQALDGSDSQRQQLIDFYNGSPLALSLVSTTIKELFDGDIGEFLSQYYPQYDVKQEDNGLSYPLPSTLLPIVGGIRQLLDSQFERLSPLEHRIMYWLAINREPIPLKVLKADLVPTVPLNALVEALETLRSRCLVTLATPSRLDPHSKGFTLQGFVMEYTTNRLVEKMGAELKSGILSLFRAYALMKASAKEHIRESQKRLFLDPIAQELLTWMTPNDLETWAKNVLNELRLQTSSLPGVISDKLPGAAPPMNQSSILMGYGAGNVLNLLIHLGLKVANYNFSHLAVWQADLRQARLQGVNFTGADLSKSAFTEVIGDVLAVAYSPNGDLLATTDSDGKLHLWRTKDGVKQHTCDCQAGWVRTVAFSPQQKTVVTGDDRTVKVWDVETGQLLQSLQRHRDWVRSVCFALQGRVIISCSDDKTIKLWDYNTQTHLPSLEEHTGRIKAIACNSDQTLLASGSDDGTIQLWTLSLSSEPDSPLSLSPQAPQAPQPPQAPLSSDASGTLAPSTVGKSIICQHLRAIPVNYQVRFVTFHPTRPHILASSSDDKVIRLWDIQTGFCIKAFPILPAWVRSLAFSPDGRYLASGCDDTYIYIWDIETGNHTKTLVGHRSRIWSIAFSPDSHTLVSGSNNQSLKFWDVAQEKCLKTLQGYTRGIRTLAFHPTQPWLVSSGDDKVVRIWQLPAVQTLATGQSPASTEDSPQASVHNAAPHTSNSIRISPDPESFCYKELIGHEGRVWSVAIHPDGKRIASASDDNTIRLWNINTGYCLRLKGHEDWIRSVAFGYSPQKSKVILASGSDDRTIKLWDVETGECLKTLRYHTDWVRAVAFSPNPDIPLLASGSDDQTVGTGDSTIKMWDLTKDCSYNNLQGESASGVRALAFSPDGKLLASGSDDKIVRLSDVEKSICLLKFPHHGGRVWSVAFSPDGQTLASSSDDRTVKVWDVKTGNTIATLTEHTQRVRAVAFSPDGTLLATGSQDGKIRLWDTRNNYQFIDRLKTLKPYHQTCIQGITGVTSAQKLALMELGAAQGT